jgi:hypothetical protein
MSGSSKDVLRLRCPDNKLSKKRPNKTEEAAPPAPANAKLRQSHSTSLICAPRSLAEFRSFFIAIFSNLSLTSSQRTVSEDFYQSPINTLWIAPRLITRTTSHSTFSPLQTARQSQLVFRAFQPSCATQPPSACLKDTILSLRHRRHSSSHYGRPAFPRPAAASRVHAPIVWRCGRLDAHWHAAPWRCRAPTHFHGGACNLRPATVCLTTDSYSPSSFPPVFATTPAGALAYRESDA